LLLSGIVTESVVSIAPMWMYTELKQSCWALEGLVHPKMKIMSLWLTLKSFQALLI